MSLPRLRRGASDRGSLLSPISYLLPALRLDARRFSTRTHTHTHSRTQDAYVLSRLLGSSSATRRTLPSVLRAYEAVRRPRANKVITTTRESRRVLEYQEEYTGAAREEVTRALHRLTEWLWEGNGKPEDDVQEAERLVGVFVEEAAGDLRMC